MTDSPAPAADAAARQRIETSLEESLLVEAAAGTGKTTVLVRRLVAVLERGLTDVERIVAVTFTRKAAGELKLRLRQELDLARQRTRDPAAQENLERAVARLEEAHVGTIHSFCAEVLRARPVEAGIDPAFRELDEDEAARLYDRAFQIWIERQLAEMPPGLERALARLAAAPGFGPAGSGRSSPLDRLREAGRSLVDWRDFPAPWERRPFDRAAEIGRLVERADELADFFHRSPNRRDYLTRAIEPAAELADWVRRSEAVAERDPNELEAQLVELLWQLKRNAKWIGRGYYAPGLDRGAVVAARDAIVAELEEFKQRADADLAALLRSELLEVIDGYEELKRRTGRLDFLDLLVRARDLVRDNPEVRRYLQGRFTHLFVDEFQDTDPLQAEILLLIAADDPEVDDWWQARPQPGRLFLVGDPKQSIYRFRRADVLLYQEIKERLTAAEGGVRPGRVSLVHLTRSFRAVAPLQQAINGAFAPLMQEDHEVGQPQYIRLDPFREPEAGQPQLVALPVPEPFGWSRVTKTQIEVCLPDTAAAMISWLVQESGWTIDDPDERGRRIPIAPRHVALLFRRFLSWNRDMSRPYVEALEARGIPHLLVGGRSFHQREEVETLRAALTAVEWPDDELSVYATLRGDLFAVSDNLLLRFRLESGSLHPFRRLDDDLADDFLPIVEALEVLAKLHRQRNDLPIVETVHRLLELTRAHAGFALRPSGNQILANVQHVCDLARSFEVKGGLSFRGFVERLNAEAERVGPSQAPVLEEGADGVRMMTVHAAKGLEFPVVVLADITANLSRREPSHYLEARSRLCALKLLGCSPWELVENAELERQRDVAEGLRLAYVAATRARDLLVVPGVGTGPFPDSWVSPLDAAIYPRSQDFLRPREEAAGCPPFGRTTVLEGPKSLHGPPDTAIRPGLHRPRAGDHRVVWWDPAALKLNVEGDFGLRREQILSPDRGEGTAAAEGMARYEAWRGSRRRALERGSAPSFEVIAASQAEQPPPGPAPEVRLERLPRDPDRPSGIRFGTLVHTVLRDVAFDAGREAVRSLAELHGRMLDAPADEVEAAAGSVEAALAHPLLKRAGAAERCHREAPFLVKLDGGSDSAGGRTIEGTIDLAFLEDGTWTVVDFKTDAGIAEVEEPYRRQVAWYVYAMTVITGVPARGVLLGV